MLNKIIEPEIDKNNPWTDDKLNREKVAGFLTRLLSPCNDGFVFNLNAPWGTGKTFFLKRWQVDLSKEHPCIYFNAWETDNYEDVLFAFITEITEELHKLDSEGKVTEGIKEVAKLGFEVMKSVGKNVLSNIVDHYTAPGTTTAITEGVANHGQNIDYGKFANDAMSTYNAKKESIEKFKEALIGVVELISGEVGTEPPLFILIDELDRCRPTYAVELLENLKHIFEVPGIVFVVSCDTEQLEHSIKAIYGEGFDSKTYLRRFFDQNFKMPEPNFKSFSELLHTQFPITLGDNKHLYFPYLEEENPPMVFSEIAETFKLSLRDQQRVYIRLKAVIETATNVSDIHYGYLAILVIFQIKYNDIYEMWIKGRCEDPKLWEELGKNVKAHNNCSIIQKYRIYFSIEIQSEGKIQNRLGSLQASPETGEIAKYERNILNKLVTSLLEFKRHKQLLEFTELIS